VILNRVHAHSEEEAVEKILDRHEGWRLCCLKICMKEIDDRGDWYEYMVKKESETEVR